MRRASPHSHAVSRSSFDGNTSADLESARKQFQPRISNTPPRPRSRSRSRERGGAQKPPAQDGQEAGRPHDGHTQKLARRLDFPPTHPTSGFPVRSTGVTASGQLVPPLRFPASTAVHASANTRAVSGAGTRAADGGFESARGSMSAPAFWGEVSNFSLNVSPLNRSPGDALARSVPLSAGDAKRVRRVLQFDDVTVEGAFDAAKAAAVGVDLDSPTASSRDRSSSFQSASADDAVLFRGRGHHDQGGFGDGPGGPAPAGEFQSPRPAPELSHNNSSPEEAAHALRLAGQPSMGWLVDDIQAAAAEASAVAANAASRSALPDRRGSVQLPHPDRLGEHGDHGDDAIRGGDEAAPATSAQLATGGQQGRAAAARPSASPTSIGSELSFPGSLQESIVVEMANRSGLLRGTDAVGVATTAMAPGAAAAASPQQAELLGAQVLEANHGRSAMPRQQQPQPQHHQHQSRPGADGLSTSIATELDVDEEVRVRHLPLDPFRLEPPVSVREEIVGDVPPANLSQRLDAAGRALVVAEGPGAAAGAHTAVGAAAQGSSRGEVEDDDDDDEVVIMSSGEADDVSLHTSQEYSYHFAEPEQAAQAQHGTQQQQHAAAVTMTAASAEPTPLPPPRVSANTLAAIVAEWRVTASPDGRDYYYSKLTGVVTWTPPLSDPQQAAMIPRRSPNYAGDAADDADGADGADGATAGGSGDADSVDSEADEESAPVSDTSATVHLLRPCDIADTAAAATGAAAAAAKASLAGTMRPPAHPAHPAGRAASPHTASEANGGRTSTASAAAVPTPRKRLDFGSDSSLSHASVASSEVGAEASGDVAVHPQQHHQASGRHAEAAAVTKVRRGTGERNTTATSEQQLQQAQEHAQEQAQEQASEAVKQQEQQQRPDEWRSVSTSDGRVYFYNRRTRESRWELPPSYTGPVTHKRWPLQKPSAQRARPAHDAAGDSDAASDTDDDRSDSDGSDAGSSSASGASSDRDASFDSPGRARRPGSADDRTDAMAQVDARSRPSPASPGSSAFSSASTAPAPTSTSTSTAAPAPAPAPASTSTTTAAKSPARVGTSSLLAGSPMRTCPYCGKADDGMVLMRHVVRCAEDHGHVPRGATRSALSRARARAAAAATAAHAGDLDVARQAQEAQEAQHAAEGAVAVAVAVAVGADAAKADEVRHAAELQREQAAEALRRKRQAKADALRSATAAAAAAKAEAAAKAKKAEAEAAAVPLPRGRVPSDAGDNTYDSDGFESDDGSYAGPGTTTTTTTTAAASTAPAVSKAVDDEQFARFGPDSIPPSRPAVPGDLLPTQVHAAAAAAAGGGGGADAGDGGLQPDFLGRVSRPPPQYQVLDGQVHPVAAPAAGVTGADAGPAANTAAAASAGDVDSMPEAPERVPATTETCPSCQRTFAAGRLEKHAKVCKRVFIEKRSKYDTHRYRVKDTLLALYQQPEPCQHCGKPFAVEEDARLHAKVRVCAAVCGGLCLCVRVRVSVRACPALLCVCLCPRYPHIA